MCKSTVIIIILIILLEFIAMVKVKSAKIRVFAVSSQLKVDSETNRKYNINKKYNYHKEKLLKPKPFENNCSLNEATNHHRIPRFQILLSQQ